MELMNKLWAAAKADKRRIVLPEGDEERTIKATGKIVELGLAKPVLVGDENVIRSKAKELDVNLTGVEVIDPSLGGDPMPSNILKKVLIVGVVGVMIGIFIIFLIEFLDNKVKTPQDMEKYFNIPVLGVIPNENK